MITNEPCINVTLSLVFSRGLWLLIIEIFIVLLYDKISYGRGIYLEAVASIVTM